MITIRKIEDDKWGIWDGMNCTFLDPEWLAIPEKDIREYLKSNSFPPMDERHYTVDDMIYDMTQSSGSLIVDATEDQARWIAQMIDHLM